MQTRMYILLNDKLSKGQRIPQASHSVAEFIFKYGQNEDVKEWVNVHKTMVCLQTSLDEMKKITSHMKDDQYHFNFLTKEE